MKIDTKHYKSGELNKPAHDCMGNCTVVKCDGEHDIWRCSVCGKEWVEKCSFDENCQ